MDDFDKLSERIREDNDDVARAWEKARPLVDTVTKLIRMRKKVGLSQVEIARRAGWNKSFVSRLESGRGGMPDPTTMLRYSKACGAHMGLVWALEGEADTVVIEDTLALGEDAAHAEMFAALEGINLDPDDSAVAAG